MDTSSWHKSSYSTGGTNCVEVRESTDYTDVRDTQHREHGHLSFPANEWAAFLEEVRAGAL